MKLWNGKNNGYCLQRSSAIAVNSLNLSIAFRFYFYLSVTINRYAVGNSARPRNVMRQLKQDFVIKDLMKNIVSFLFALSFTLTSFAQSENDFEIPQRIISKYAIKELSIWKIEKVESPKPDTTLFKVDKFDKFGHLVLHRLGSLSDEYHTWTQYIFDSSGHLKFEYKIDEEGYITEIKEYIFRQDLLTETRNYGLQYHEIHLKDFDKIRNHQYQVETMTYNSKGQLTSNSYCSVFPPKIDSIIENDKRSDGSVYVELIPKKNIINKSPSCSWIVYNTLDKSGNIIRQKTDPTSVIFIDDSFAYDKRNQITYRITFNSGDISKNNSRNKVIGENRETRYENIYDKNNRLIEVKTFFNNLRTCYLRTTYEYDTKGILKRKQIFKVYPSECQCNSSIDRDEIGNLSCIKGSNSASENVVISDTLYYYEYNEFGEQTDYREYCGIGQIDPEGTLFYQKFRKVNEIGLSTYSFSFYGKSDNLGLGYEHLNASKFENYYTHYENGLIWKIKKSEGSQYLFKYEFY
ncbi:MAG: hypothetical protein V4538_00615 [Bacteroidota bacterium]